MSKIKTSIMELLLKEVLIGKKFYDNDGTIKTIDDLNYQPSINTIYVKSGNDGYSFSMNEFYEFDLDYSKRDIILPNKGRIKNK